MRFGNFLFPESRDPLQDGQLIDEILQEVQLSEALGMDTVWLSEHHFDGACAYVDPITFAAASPPARSASASASPSRRCRCTTRSASPNSSR